MSMDYENQPQVKQPGWDVYSTMLILSLTSLVIGCVLLVLEMQEYGWELGPN